jgi:Arc/MetJ-type ribon-helix-helix transcriptional regulator
LKAIESLTGQNGLYPSRSELIRVAVRSFLIRELDAAKSFEKYQLQSQQRSMPQQKPEIDENLFVQVPLQGEGTEYKTYKLVKK